MYERIIKIQTEAQDAAKAGEIIEKAEHKIAALLNPMGISVFSCPAKPVEVPDAGGEEPK